VDPFQFTVRYIDREWVEADHLRVEDADMTDVVEAVIVWCRVRQGGLTSLSGADHGVAKAKYLILEVQDG